MSNLLPGLPSALVFLLVLLPAGLAAEVSWSADLGWEGVTVPGNWTPLRVEAPGAQGPWSLTVNGSPLLFPGPGVFERPVFLPDGVETLDLTRWEGGVVREQRVLPVATLAFPGHLILVDGVGSAVRRALAEVLLPEEPVTVAAAPASRWPTSFLSYGGVSALVVADPGPVLSPAQTQALRAWLASGGRLAVVGRRPPSLVDQVGTVDGFGAVGSDPGNLGLAPYGTRIRPGTDFSPSAEGLPGPGPATPATLAFLGAWAVIVLVLARRRSVSWGPIAGLTALAGTAVLVLTSWGAPWDRGVQVHSRQVILPGGTGAVTSVEAILSQDRAQGVEWPLASLWGLELWKVRWMGQEAAIRTSDENRVVLETFDPAPDRNSDLRVRWAGKVLSWFKGAPLESPPPELKLDVPWISRVAASTPGVEWTVGWEPSPEGGTLCWLLPRPGHLP